ncbi:MAG: TetR/AcrR family transcriptional regulator [Nocardiaceae bacterium]|nr:TetR/AcrR family transcriptional regulator [Nocardiaceae bacterium]
MSVKQTSPKRGRRPQSAAESDRVRAHIVSAAGEVFAEFGSRGCNVARIIERAEIARPTFYRYFANAIEPLNVLLDESDEALVRGVAAAVASTDDSIEMGIRVIDAYLDWARSRGNVLRPLFAELYDLSSPVCAHRERALDLIRKLIVEKTVELGRPAPTPLVLDSMLNACEFVVFRVLSEGLQDSESLAEARITMIRMALVTVGNTDDIARALTVPGLFLAPPTPGDQPS